MSTKPNLPTNVDIREFRADVLTHDDERVCSGYAVVFDQESADLGGFNELILPKSIILDDDVKCLKNHNDCMILGCLKAKTLTLQEDDKGLWFSCQIPPTTYGNDLVISATRGDVWQCSFGFYIVKDEWVDRGRDTPPLRIVHQLRCDEVSCAVVFPAYANATHTIRSLHVFEQARLRARQYRANKNRLQLSTYF
jgi:uncharacterized protein